MKNKTNLPRLLPFNLLDVNNSNISEEELNVISSSVWLYMIKMYKKIDKIVNSQIINENTLLDLKCYIDNAAYANHILKRFNQNYDNLHNTYVEKYLEMVAQVNK